MKTDVIIIGAGLTGLTTAFWLKHKGLKVTVVEERGETGGQIKTFTEKGFTFESGPNTGVVSEPEVAELMAELEKTSNGKCKLETAPDASKRRLIWKGNRFHELPSGLISAVFTPLFKFSDKLRILGEPWRKKGTDPNESIASLATRRLGKSFVDYAVDPFLSGVYAGNPHTLVTRFALPKLYNLEQNYGSFIRGSIAKAKLPKSDRDRLATKKVFSAIGGLSRITEAETEYIGKENIILNAKDVVVTPLASGWQVSYTDVNGETVSLEATKVVTTCGAYALPNMLPFIAKERMQKLSSLVYAPVVEIALGVKDALGGDYKAFGGLVPTIEQRKVLGILYPSACFTGRAPEGGALFTYFIGGVKNAELVQKSDEELTELAVKEFHEMLKFPISSKPDIVKIFRHEHAIPQYELSSGERFAEVERLQKDYPGLIIAGNLRDGIGMAHRIKQATVIANSL